MQVLFIIFFTLLSFFSSAQIIYKMEMDVQSVEPMIGRACIEDTTVVWAMHKDTLQLMFLDKYLVYSELSRKDWKNLDENTKRKFTQHLDQNNITGKDITYILRNKWGDIYIVRFIINRKKGVLIILISEYNEGVPSYTLSFGTNTCN